MRILDFAVGVGFAILTRQASIVYALSRSSPASPAIPWLQKIGARQLRLGLADLSTVEDFYLERDEALNASALLEPGIIHLMQAAKKSPPEQWAAANHFADMVAHVTPSINEQCLMAQKNARELIPLHPFRHLPEVARGISDKERARCDSAWLAALKDTHERMQPVIKVAVADLAQYAPEVYSSAQIIREQIETIRQSSSQILRQSLDDKMLDDRTDLLLAIRGKIRSLMQKDENSGILVRDFQSHRLLVQMAPHYPDIDPECLSLRMAMSSPGVVDYLRSSRDHKQWEKELRCHRAWKHAMHDVWKTFLAEENFPEFFPPEGQTILDIATYASQDETAAEQVGEDIYGINRGLHGEEILDLDRASHGTIRNGLRIPEDWNSKSGDEHSPPNEGLLSENTQDQSAHLHTSDLEQVLSPQVDLSPTEDVDEPEDPHDDPLSELTCHDFGAEMPPFDECANLLQLIPSEASGTLPGSTELARRYFLNSIRARILHHSENRLEQVAKAKELLLSNEYIKQTSHHYPQLSPECSADTSG